MILLWTTFLTGCTLFNKETGGSDDMKSLVQEVIREKGSPGIRIEIMKLPSQKSS